MERNQVGEADRSDCFLQVVLERIQKCLKWKEGKREWWGEGSSEGKRMKLSKHI